MNTIIRIDNSVCLLHPDCKVKRKRAPKKALDATGYKQYTDSNVLDSMPEDDTSLTSHKYYFP